MYSYQPGSYADLFYTSPYGYVPRRPSPPPSAYYSRCNPYDRYSEELAREQATRAALLKAAQQERARRAIAARAEEQRRLQAIEQARRQRAAQLQQQHQHQHQRLRQPQTWFDFPVYTPYADEDQDEGEDESEDDGHTPTPEPQREASSSNSLQPTIPHEPTEDMEKMEDAARTIQAVFRRHAALKHVSAIRDRFQFLDSAFALPTHLAFQADSFTDELERGKLAYTKENALVHTFVDNCEKMLQELDAVESRGVAEVRDARKELVREIECRLHSLEEDVKKAWRDQQVPSSPSEEAILVSEISNTQTEDAETTREAPIAKNEGEMFEEDATADRIEVDNALDNTMDVGVNDASENTIDAEEGREVEDALLGIESNRLDEEQPPDEDDSKEFVLV